MLTESSTGAHRKNVGGVDGNDMRNAAAHALGESKTRAQKSDD
jgi:hypothetical protein